MSMVTQLLGTAHAFQQSVKSLWQAYVYKRNNALLDRPRPILSKEDLTYSWYIVCVKRSISSQSCCPGSSLPRVVLLRIVNPLLHENFITKNKYLRILYKRDIFLNAEYFVHTLATRLARKSLKFLDFF